MPGNALNCLRANREIIEARGIQQDLERRQLAARGVKRVEPHLELLERIGIFGVGLLDLILQRTDAAVQLIDALAGQIDALLIILNLRDQRLLIRLRVRRFGTQGLELCVQLLSFRFILRLLFLDFTDLRIVLGRGRGENIRRNQKRHRQHAGGDA